MKDKLINAIVSGDTKKLNEVLREQKGQVYVIKTFLDHMKMPSHYIDNPNVEIIFEETPYTIFLMELDETKKRK